MDALFEDDKRMPFSNGQFGKAYNEAITKLAKLNLFQSEYRIVFLLLSLVRPSSGLIAYGNYKPVNFEWVAKELELSYKTVSRAITRLTDFGIICKACSSGITMYFFNPYIYQKGRYINKTLFEMFKKSEWAKQEDKQK
jgi:DNA-binding transcriptional ArsR family regulator